MTRCGVRELRATLRTKITAERATLIGGPYELRAILVPIPTHSRWNDAERKKALREAKRRFAAAIKDATP